MSRRVLFIVSFAFMLVSYCFLVSFFPAPRVSIYPNLVERNIGESQHLIFSGKSPKVVLVGSSLGSRLQYRTFDSCFANLSLSGESSLTGLELLARSSLHPELVIIELNVLHRDLDSAFIAEVDNVFSRNIKLLRAEYRPVNLVMSYASSIKYRTEVEVVSAAESKVDPRILEIGLNVQKGEYRKLLDPALLKARLTQFKIAIDALMLSGTKVVLLEMPVDPALRELKRALQIRSAILSTFPGLEYWDVGSWADMRTVRTRDGLHVTIEDAVRIGYEFGSRLGCHLRPS